MLEMKTFFQHHVRYINIQWCVRSSIGQLRRRECVLFGTWATLWARQKGNHHHLSRFPKYNSQVHCNTCMIRMGGQNHASHWWCKLLPQNVWRCWYFACVREPFHRTVRNVAYRGRQKVMVHTGTMPVGLLARSSCQILWHVSGRSHALREAMPLCIYVALFMSASMLTWTARRLRCWTTPDSPWRWKEAADMKPIEMAFCFGQTLTTVQK